MRHKNRRHRHRRRCGAAAGSERWPRRVAVGAALAVGAVILSPYLLPTIGVGDASLAEEAMLAMHPTGLGRGLAGAVNTVVHGVPVVGPALAEGGWFASAAVGAGACGVMLGRAVDEKRRATQGICWGKWLKRQALASIALISLPAFCTGASAGVIYLCAAFSGSEMASSAVALMSDTLGSVGRTNAAAAGAAVALPHLLSCAAPLIPAAVSLGAFKLKKDNGVRAVRRRQRFLASKRST